MKENPLVGLIKFFQEDKEAFLDKLVSGYFHCNTPESYRLRNENGISDPVESCRSSYRTSRGDDSDNYILIIDGHQITGIDALTVHNSDSRDSWLHCWLELRVPANEIQLKELNENIQRMKNEFGNYYAFLPIENLDKLIKLLDSSSKLPVSAGSVKYSDNQMEWGNLCKSIPYTYQNEYRFLFGECSPSELEPYEFQLIEPIENLILKNVELQLLDQRTGEVWFELSAQ